MASGPPQRLVFVGDGFLLRRCGELALARGHQIRGLCTANPAIVQWAAGLHIPVVPEPARLAGLLEGTPVDWLFSIANLTLLPTDVLGLAARGSINYHDGPLPRHAGLNAPIWALLERERSHGITWHLMTGQADRGDIVRQRLFPIADDETALSLNLKCYAAGAETFGEVLDELAAGRLVPVPQDFEARSWHGRWDRPAAQCTIDWRNSAAEIAALSRALDFGPYANPIGVPKFMTGSGALAVRSIRMAPDAGGAGPGTIVSLDDGELRVATADGDVLLSGLVPLDGTGGDSLRPGTVLPPLDAGLGERLGAVHRRLAPSEPYWTSRLEGLEPVDPPYAHRSSSGQAPRTSALPASLRADPAESLVPALAGYLARVRGVQVFDIGYRDQAIAEVATPEVSPWVAGFVPLRIACNPAEPFRLMEDRIAGSTAELRRAGTFLRDLTLRISAADESLEPPARRGLPIAIDLAATGDTPALPAGCQLLLSVNPDTGECSWRFDANALSPADVGRIDEQLCVLLDAARRDPAEALGALPLIPEREQQSAVAAPERSHAFRFGPATVHGAFEEQAARSPDGTALIFRDQRLTWQELDAEAGRVAEALRGLGVERGALVGLCAERTPRMVAALLGILKAGAAYVPLDPAYPAERLRFMLEDAAVSVLVTERHLTAAHETAAPVLLLDDLPASVTPGPDGTDRASGNDLAYVIYTSGSTGRPKGVMISHRNVMNLFAGMDERIGADGPGTWLAVTSISFDISVLELLWTLARGWTVVLHAGDPGDTGSRHAPTAAQRAPGKPVEFSLFYFASDEGADGADRYRLLIEGARFADTHGFAAVWTPERHFHAFGGLYPNPSVTSAALAMVTSRIAIRAGSVVMPLHSPIRVAEEWAVVDNLSGGRTGISFASGWHPNDFVLRPENFAESRTIMRRDIDVVRRLWRGEELSFPGPDGRPVSVRTLPRPVQAELPCWITSAGNPETFRLAGELGVNVLTHLLGQTAEELQEKLAAYRAAWREAGHPGAGHVTLMLHTFIGADAERVRATVRAPLTGYLRSSVNLMKPFAASFPAFRRQPGKPAPVIDLEHLSGGDMESLLEYSFERYYEANGLFGTPATCLATVERLAALGVDEIACLVDFGVATDEVLEGLTHLNELRERSSAAAESAGPAAPPADESIAALIRRHGVTHMQCTPSLAGMLVEDPAAREAIASLRLLLIGGEAFAPALAARLEEAGATAICNMYGPTETTVWSSTHVLRRGERVIPLGQPIANTEFRVVDDRLQPVPRGVEGELLIGGEGVAAGYLHRPELTAERFVPDPLRNDGSRLYRTGDRVREEPDGSLVFLGRTDLQVKIGGVRIEPGEIEHALSLDPGVREAAVVAREENGVPRLVAYVVSRAGSTLSEAHLRAHLHQRLPAAMIPTAWAFLNELPRTPNGKLDRGALPATGQARPGLGNEFVAPRDSLELQLAEAWEEVLDRHPVGVTDSFFDLGGHSLLAVSLVGSIRRLLGYTLSPATLLKAPTIAAMAELMRQEPGAETATLVPLRIGGRRPPLFLIHWISGHVFSYRSLAARLDEEQPVYGIQARGLLGEDAPEDDLERMAAHYIEAIRTVQPHGPYHLGGACFGGIVAFEMARQLGEAGEEVALLAMLHSAAPSSPFSRGGARARFNKWEPGVRLWARTLRQLPWPGRKEFVITKLRNLRKRLRDRAATAADPAAERSTRLLTVKDAARLAERRYLLRPSPGNVTVFRAENWRASLVNPTPDLGWRRWHAGRTEIHETPGIELGILDEPHVRHLARALQDALERATPTPARAAPAPSRPPAAPSSPDRPAARPDTAASRRVIRT